jgi:penicillin amidase
LEVRKVWRALKVFFLLVLVAAVALVGWGWLFVRSTLPAYSATLTVPGLEGEVVIYRDEYGVPHIYAGTVHDLFFAQGYVQAQDRLWQMDLSRRAVQGRLAEIFGPDFVDADHFLRTLGFYRAAEASLSVYEAEVLAVAEAFAAGVNTFIEQTRSRSGEKAAPRLPIEFSILGYEPEPWTVTDSAAIGKYMAWVLGGNMKAELFYLAALAKLGPEKTAELFPVYPEDGPVISEVPYAGFGRPEAATRASGRAAAGEAEHAAARAAAYAAARASEALARLTSAEGEKTAAALARLMDVVDRARLGLGPAGGSGLGSNNWVVSGERTATGRPLLANDMHLEIKAPSIWYQNHLVCPGEFNVTGVIFPGVPGVIVGHNERVAWGVTNVGPDVQDLYIERPNPADPYQFEYDGEWEAAVVLEEQIRVKGLDEPVVREIVVTRHGPIITSVFSGGEEAEEEDGADEDGAAALPPLALRWTALDKTCELGAVLAFDKAEDWEDFKAALEMFKVPAQNFVFADVDGNIAYRANGLIPIRSEAAVEAGFSGLLPVPGWDSAYEWTGFIPWEELPALENPAAGVIVTANNRVAPPGYPYFISHAWAPPYRAASIWRELHGREDLTVEDMQAIQNDTKNLMASRLWPALEALLAPRTEEMSPTEKAAYDVLAAWASDDPRDDTSEAGPTIFHTFYFAALEATFKDELGEDLFPRYVENGSPVNTFDTMLLAGESDWFDDVSTADRVETASDTLLVAFRAAVAKLEDALGGQPGTWEWGKVHTITFDHPMGGVSFLRPFVNRRPFPTDGSSITAEAKGYDLGDFPYAVKTAAPWRFVADLSDLDRCYDILAIGVSGQPLSPHYDDQMRLWLEGGYKVMYFDREEIESLRGVAVTVLSPAADKGEGD